MTLTTNQDERLQILVDEQIRRVSVNNVFTQEASYIHRVCERKNIRRITDFGSWCGVLAQEVFNTGIVLDNYHLVDAVPYYMDRALHLLDNRPITYETVTLIPPSYKQPLPASMLVHPYDTLNTSSIYSPLFLKDFVKRSAVQIPVARTQSLKEYIENNRDKFTPDTYVKIDLDGVDIEFVAEILRSGLEPGAVQFEVWATARPVCEQIMKILANLGYSIPRADLNVHKNYSVAVSKNYWWAVGYDNAAGQINFTYYDQDHGSQAVSLDAPL
jgi:hypothetical protein